MRHLVGLEWLRCETLQPLRKGLLRQPFPPYNHQQADYYLNAAKKVSKKGVRKKVSALNGTSLSSFCTVFAPMLCLDHFMAWRG